MYQINLRAHASKLATLATRVQRGTADAPRRRVSSLRAVLVGLAQLATLRVILEGSTNSVAPHDPRDPRNW